LKVGVHLGFPKVTIPEPVSIAIIILSIAGIRAFYGEDGN
jgi:hypothetical protein